MNSKRPTDGIPKLPRSQFVVLREDFDTFGQASAFDSHSQFQCQVVDVDSALASQSWPLHKNPKVTSPLAHFQRGFHLVLLEKVLQLEQILHRADIVRVNRDPL